MKILLVGNADSIWIKTTIQYTILPYGDEATILDINKNVVYKDYYEAHGIKVITGNIGKGRIRRLMSGKANEKTFKEGFDVICIHFVKNSSLAMIPFARKNCKNIVIVFWGSDLFRLKGNTLLWRYAFSKANSIVLNTNEMISEFHREYGYSYDFKLKKARFGSTIIELLREYYEKDDNLPNIKTEKCTDKEKVIIAVGYNRMKQQNHIKVLNALRSLPQSLKCQIHFVLLLTYGNGDSDYICNVKNAVEETGCSYTIYQEYLSNEKIANIIAGTDIFIHAQESDARSASVCEFLYSQCLVINPSWIKYSDFEDKSYFFRFREYNELPSIVEKIFSKKEQSIYREKLCQNSKAMYAYCSWNTYAKEWRQLYTSHLYQEQRRE